MPAKPAWYRRLPHIIRAVQEHPEPFLDRVAVESLLGVGRRRAQQIMAPCVSWRVGSNGLADRQALIAHLGRIASSEEGAYEIRRRQKVAGLIGEMRRQRLETPQLLVEAPSALVHQEWEKLPGGVRLEPGRITVEFQDPQQALEKLLALAMAVSNDFDQFEKRVSDPSAK